MGFWEWEKVVFQHGFLGMGKETKKEL